MRHEYRILGSVNIAILGHDVGGESGAADREGVEQWVWSLEVVVGLEWERLDSGCEIVRPGGEVERAIERSVVPGGEHAMDAGVGSDDGICGRGERD